RLDHKSGEAEQFYRALAGQQVRVGVEATGTLRWFERLLEELRMEMWVGDPIKVRAAAARKAKTDKRDAELLLRLLLENRFPRIWVPTAEQRDARQLVLHRHRLVQARTRAKNQLHAIAANERTASEAACLEQGWAKRVDGLAVAALDQRTTPGLARTTGRVKPANAAFGCCSAAAS